MDSNQNKPDNRRNFVRLDFPIPLKSQLLRKTSSEALPITLINLSATGVALICPDELHVGEVVTVVIPLPILTGNSFEMGAVPINHYAKKSGGIHYGLSFLTKYFEDFSFVTEEKKAAITRYINQYLIEQRKKGVW